MTPCPHCGFFGCLGNCRYSTDAAEPMPARFDVVAHPPHYTSGNIECIDFIIDKGLNFCLGNAIKYIVRCNHKGKKREDLLKAKQYINFELEKGGNDE